MIEHLPQHARFQTVVDGELCVLDYRLAAPLMTITHTEVPPAVEGRGIAAELTEAALAYARSSGFKVRPACAYARAYIQRHPETRDLLA